MAIQATALRNKVLVDGQVEYRMPLWNIFGVTAWAATGRLADKFSNLSIDGFWLSFGGGVPYQGGVKIIPTCALIWDSALIV